MTIAEKITALQNAKDAIADAITDMGGTVSAGDGFADFALDIATIPSGGSVTDGIIVTYTGNDMTKIDVYYSHDVSNFVIPDIYRKNTVTQIQFHSKDSAQLLSLAKDGFVNLIGVQSINIPSSVTSIGENCFRGCSSLASINIPSGVTSLDSSCFYGCSSLTSINIPSGVTSLGSSCFYNCSSLASINIPSSVTSINSLCFSSCRSFEEIHFKATTPATVSNSNAWRYIPTTCKIYVPTGSLSAYTSAANYPSASTYTYIEE